MPSETHIYLPVGIESFTIHGPITPTLTSQFTPSDSKLLPVDTLSGGILCYS
jgi:hypothetical protein